MTALRDHPKRSASATPVPTGVLGVTSLVALILGTICLLLLDGGVAFRLFLVSLLTQCGLVALLMARRPQRLSFLDRMLIQFGLLPLFGVFCVIQWWIT